MQKKSKAGYYHDPELQIALNWQKEHKPNIIWARRYHAEFNCAMAFLRESNTAQEASKTERYLTESKITLAKLLALGSLIFALLQAHAAFRELFVEANYLKAMEGIATIAFLLFASASLIRLTRP